MDVNTTNFACQGRRAGHGNNYLAIGFLHPLSYGGQRVRKARPGVVQDRGASKRLFPSAMERGRTLLQKREGLRRMPPLCVAARLRNSYTTAKWTTKNTKRRLESPGNFARRGWLAPPPQRLEENRKMRFCRNPPTSVLSRLVFALPFPSGGSGTSGPFCPPFFSRSGTSMKVREVAVLSEPAMEEADVQQRTANSHATRSRLRCASTTKAICSSRNARVCV